METGRAKTNKQTNKTNKNKKTLACRPAQGDSLKTEVELGL